MDTIIYNNHDLSEVIRIIEVIRPVGNERSVTTNDAPLLGVNVQDLKIGPKKIKVKFAIHKKTARDAEGTKHVLASILNTNKPVRITISDEPDKYYLGMAVGAVDMDIVARWFQKGEFDILIPDGVSHAITYKRFDNPKQEGNKLVFDLVNNGNVDAFPVVTVRNNSENGYIGLVNPSGAMELGNREETDLETYKQSEILFDYVTNNGIVKGFAAARKESGALQIENNWGRPHLALVPGNNSGTISWDIPVDSSGQRGALNDYLWWRQICWLGAGNQMGLMKINFMDDTGRFIYGVETYKRWFGLECEYNFLVRGDNGPRLVKKWQFTGTHYDHHNPFNAERGWSDIQRRDDMVQVFWWGTYPQFHIPEIKGIKTAKIQVIISSISNNPMISHLYLDSLVYRKDFVTGIRDVPNRYRPGSTVVIDCENDGITVDGLNKFSDRVHGSSWLKVPPGNSKLEVYCSSWAKNKPTVAVNFEERWL